MQDFRSQIARHRDAFSSLHKRIHETVKFRDRSERDKAAWIEACSNFHGFRSEVSTLLRQVNAGTISQDEKLRRFVFDYFAVDPIYFRSGYAKERLIRLIKSLDLSSDEKNILRQTILRRIRNGALREFRQLCHLIPKIQTEAFLIELRTEAQSSDVNVKRRAEFALNYACGRVNKRK